MPRIVTTGTASPPHRLDVDSACAWASRVFAGSPHLPLALRVLRSSGVAQRHMALPLERVVARRGFRQRSAEYFEAAVDLAQRAAEQALERAQLDARAVDMIVTTSCTGVMLPSLGAHLAPRLGLRSDVVRLPITELGCAAGAASLARASDYLAAYPTKSALCISIELASTTFQPDDPSPTNMVAAALFGDGAGAAIVRGDDAAPTAGEHPGPRIIASRSHLFPSTTRLMGFDAGDSGFRIVLSREVPEYLRGKLGPLVTSLCAERGLSPSDLSFFAIHPGGRRILSDMERELGLRAPAFDGDEAAALAASWAVLKEHGNMSSAAVLYVLDELARRPPPKPGQKGLLAAFGPGFAAELSLLEWA